jgi:hypothetical protein
MDERINKLIRFDFLDLVTGLIGKALGYRYGAWESP